MAEVSALPIAYKEGDTIQHPSGAIYQRIGGVWKLIQYPDGRKVNTQ